MPEPEEAPAGRAGGRVLTGIPVVALRCAQFAIDVALNALLALIPVAAMLYLPRNPDGTLGSLLVAVPLVLAILLCAVLISWWYWAVRPAARGGQTPAMRWLGLRVVSADGSPASAGQLTARWALLLLDGSFWGLVGLAAMLLTARGQRLGDVVADTLVVRA